MMMYTVKVNFPYTLTYYIPERKAKAAICGRQSGRDSKMINNTPDNDNISVKKDVMIMLVQRKM